MFTITASPDKKLVPAQNPAVAFYKTSAGTLQIFYTNQGITKTTFVDGESYAYTPLAKLPKNLIPSGTAFQLQVWHALCKIPSGKTVSYEQIAHAIGKPTAYRAVANAIGKNPIAYFIPCHRVIRKNGDLCGFFWGIEKKAALLRAENDQV